MSQVVRRLNVAQAQLARRVMVVGPFDRHRMRRAVDGLDRVGGFEPEADVQRFDRMIRVLEGSERQQEVDQPVVSPQQLRIADLDRPLGVGRDGKDARLEQSVAHVFQQGRIALSPHDLFVNSPRVVLVEESSRQLLAVIKERQVADGRILGDGEEELGLERHLAGVLKDLRHADFGRLVVHVGLHVDGADLIRRPGRSRNGMRKSANGRMMRRSNSRVMSRLVRHEDSEPATRGATSSNRRWRREMDSLSCVALLDSTRRPTQTLPLLTHEQGGKFPANATASMQSGRP